MPGKPPFAELLIEWEDRIQGAVLVGMLTEDRGATSRVAASSLGNPSPCDGLVRGSSVWSPSWRE
jgi:hypothetical protein